MNFIVDEVDVADFEFDTDEFDFDDSSNGPDIKDLALTYISSFFQNREMHCGGPIPQKILLTQRNLRLVLNSSIDDELPRIYNIMEPIYKQVDSESGLIADDVKLVISVLNECSKHSIPKKYAAGILIMYLEYCEGLDFNWI